MMNRAEEDDEGGGEGEKRKEKNGDDLVPSGSVQKRSYEA